MCPDLLIAGAFHIGNLGDDAIALAEREFFKNKGWQVKIARVAEGYDLIRNVDAIVLGGGGIIYDTSIANVNNYMGYIQRNKDKPIALCLVGTQGITTQEGIQLYRKYLNKVKLITVRDPYDKVVLRKIGITVPIEVGEDAAWLLSLSPSYKVKKLGWGVRTLNNLALYEKVKPKIERYHNSIIKLYKLGEPVYCFSHDDLEWLRTFTNPIQASNIIELSEKIDVNYMIISRFHALILSIMKEVTPIVLTGRMDYSTKVSCFLNRFPMKNVIEWTQPDIFQRLEALKSNPFLEDSKQLNSITCICKERALKAINLVDNVLKEGLK